MKPIVAKLSTSPQSSFKYKWIKLDSFEFNWHCHPEFELMLMLRSTGKRFVGDSISYYREGDLVFVGSALPHTLYSPAQDGGHGQLHEAILIQFVEDFAGLCFSDAPELRHVHRVFRKASKGIQIRGKTRDIVARRMKEMSSLSGMDRLLNLLAILDTLGTADDSDLSVLSSLDFAHDLQPLQQSRIDSVCTYINQNYEQKLKLEDAAAIASMSTTAFCRFFKRSTGKTFVDYVNELRIGHACRLLIESELTISEICFEVGFNNVSNFNRRFLERHQMCPKHYRSEFVVQA